jgi:hypothetical protein
MRKALNREVTFSDVLSYKAWPLTHDGALPMYAKLDTHAKHEYLIGVSDEQASRVLENVLPFLGQLLSEKTAEVRDKLLEELVEFMAGKLVKPSDADTQMAQRLAARRARILNEFGFITAEALAEKNHSKSTNRCALTDNWKKRRQVFSVSHRDASGKTQDVFPLFQFDDCKPIRAIQAVLEVFAGKRTPWKIAFWFTASNGWLPDQARPIDLLESNLGEVVKAAEREISGSGA